MLRSGGGRQHFESYFGTQLFKTLACKIPTRTGCWPKHDASDTPTVVMLLTSEGVNVLCLKSAKNSCANVLVGC